MYSVTQRIKNIKQPRGGYVPRKSFEIIELNDNTKLNEDEKVLLENTAIKTYKALRLKDYGRVDIILKDGIPYVLEINSLPGLMKGKSALYRMAEATDLGCENLVLKIVETAIKRYNLK